jgi:HEAT repeat protein
MNSKPSAQSREGIRIKVFGFLLAPLALIIVLALLARSHSRTPASQTKAESTTTASSDSTISHTTTARPHETAHASQATTEPETERLIALLLEKTTPFPVRRQSARSLAALGTEQAMAALKSALTNDLPPHIKAAIAESLGTAPNPEAAELLHELVHGKDETTARGAARGLAARGDADSVDTLGNLLFNDQTPLSVRTEAALALGDVDLPTAQDLLTRAIAQIHDEDVLESALDGLGRRPFSETQDFFRNYLNSPDVPADAKVLAIEAVRDADGEVVPFLSNYLTDANPEVRSAAKDALDFLDPTPAKPPGK